MRHRGGTEWLAEKLEGGLENYEPAESGDDLTYGQTVGPFRPDRAYPIPDAPSRITPPERNKLIGLLAREVESLREQLVSSDEENGRLREQNRLLLRELGR